MAHPKRLHFGFVYWFDISIFLSTCTYIRFQSPEDKIMSKSEFTCVSPNNCIICHHSLLLMTMTIMNRGDNLPIKCVCSRSQLYINKSSIQKAQLRQNQKFKTTLDMVANLTVIWHKPPMLCKNQLGVRGRRMSLGARKYDSLYKWKTWPPERDWNVHFSALSITSLLLIPNSMNPCNRGKGNREKGKVE